MSRKAKVFRKHNCQESRNNTAKSVEADVAVSMVKGHTGKQVQVKCVAMDNDATTASKLKKEIEGEIIGMKDLNYCKKENLRSHMEDLQRNHKELTFTVVKYFQTMFAYVLHQNKNDPEKIRCDLLNVVNHAFGTHDNCGKSCCGFLQNP